MKRILILILILPLLMFAQNRVGSSSIKKTQDVAIQDQTTLPLIAYFNNIGESTTINGSTSIDDYFIKVTDTTGVGDNDYIFVFDPLSNRLYQGNVLSVGNDTLYVDSPLDFAFPDGSFLDFTNRHMNVDASSTPQTFGLRGISPQPIGETFDITRIIFVIITSTIPEATDFGDITNGLTNGLMFRKRDGTYNNYFNVKDNMELASMMFDLRVYEEAKTFDVNAVVGRMTWAGQNKIGIALRIPPGVDVEFILSDNYSTLLDFFIIAEGHIVKF